MKQSSHVWNSLSQNALECALFHPRPIKTVKESVKSNAPSELKRKNLLVNEDKTEDCCIQRTGDQSWKKCRFLGSLLGNKEDVNRRNNLPVKLLTYTSLLYVQIRSASNSELEYFKLLYHLYFFIILSYGLSQKHRTINWMFSKEYSCDKL